MLLDVLPKNLIALKTFNSEFLCIEGCFTYQNSKQIEIEAKINVPLATN